MTLEVSHSAQTITYVPLYEFPIDTRTDKSSSIILEQNNLLEKADFPSRILEVDLQMKSSNTKTPPIEKTSNIVSINCEMENTVYSTCTIGTELIINAEYSTKYFDTFKFTSTDI